MRRFFFASFSCLVICLSACGSDDGGGGSGGSSGAGGSGGSLGTTCADGYPKTDTPCAVPFEQCKSCGTYECCDIFECQQGLWVQTQFHTLCPSDAGADATDGESDAGDPDASDAAGE